MHTIQAWLRAQKHPSDQNQPRINQSDLRRLLAHLLQQDNAWLFAHQDFELNPQHIQQLDHWLKQLGDGFPLAYITGQQLFWDLDLLVDSNTLIPRPDTETIVEVALNILATNHPKHILDLGTGSGALALALGRVFPDAQVIGIDQSSGALNIAKRNALRNQVKNVQFMVSDWFTNLNNKTFDLIVSNPPYIADDDEHLNHLIHEPTAALVSDQEGLGDFIRITEQAPNYLTEFGLLMFEHGWQQKDSVQTIMSDAGFRHVNSVKDLAGIDRVTYGYKK